MANRMSTYINMYLFVCTYIPTDIKRELIKTRSGMVRMEANVSNLKFNCSHTVFVYQEICSSSASRIKPILILLHKVCANRVILVQ